MRCRVALILVSCLILLLRLIAVEGADRKTPARLETGSLDASLLVAQFDRAIQSSDTAQFERSVATSFRESTLTRLVRHGTTAERRAAVYALGAVGSFQANAAVAQGLKDKDAVVRAMADRALRAIWFRASTPENNERLRKVMVALQLERYAEAVRQADDLVKRDPNFAEAYNQRAIFAYATGRYDDSILDCQRTLERNPYHLGALSGMGQCYLLTQRPTEALAVFRKALAIDPYNESLKGLVADLEQRR